MTGYVYFLTSMASMVFGYSYSVMHFSLGRDFAVL